MNYTKMKKHNYRLHFIQTNKFKKNTIKLCFRSKIDSFIDGLKRDILCNLLVLGTEQYPSQRHLEIKCEDLFGAHLSINNNKAGNYYIFSITITILDDKYTMENTTLEAVEFLKDVLLKPKLINNSFSTELIEMAKKMYIDDIKSIEDNPNYLSKIKMRYYTDKASIYAFNPYFYIDEITKITAEDLFTCYQDIFNKSYLDIAIIGDLNKNIITRFEDITNNMIQPEISPYAVLEPKKEQEIIEEGQYNQSKLNITCHLKNLTLFEKQYVMYVYSYILGGSSDSLIFKKLRQDNSLCYYANSDYIFLYQMLEINAGIQSENYEKAKELIKNALAELKDGIFDEEEIEKAKITYQNSWKEIMDNPNSIINMYLSHEYYGLDLSMDRIKEIEKVTKDDIINISKKISISTIYLLKGINEND